jgi:hypothetical protein
MHAHGAGLPHCRRMVRVSELWRWCGGGEACYTLICQYAFEVVPPLRGSQIIRVQLI